MSRTETMNTETAVSFPRVSGDEPPQLRLYGLGALFSPRERG